MTSYTITYCSYTYYGRSAIFIRRQLESQRHAKSKAGDEQAKHDRNENIHSLLPVSEACGRIRRRQTMGSCRAGVQRRGTNRIAIPDPCA